MYSVIDISTYEIRWFLVCFCLFYPYFDVFSSDFSNICQHSYHYNYLYINILKIRMTVTDVFQLYTCAHARERLPSLHSSHGLSVKGVVGPIVLGVTATQFLAHLEISGCPETGQVLGELHRLVTGGEKLHQYGTLAAIDTGSGGETETLLKTNTQHRCFGTLTVVNADATARGHLYVGGGQRIPRLLLIVCQHPPYDFRHAYLVQFGCGACLAYIQWEPLGH